MQLESNERELREAVKAYFNPTLVQLEYRLSLTKSILFSTFQSHIGAIRIAGYRSHALGTRPYFNPTLVQLEFCRQNLEKKDGWYFNPTLVQLELDAVVLNNAKAMYFNPTLVQLE